MPRFTFVLLALVLGGPACGGEDTGGTRYGWARAGIEARIEGANGVAVSVPAGALDADVRIGVAPVSRSRRPGGAVAVADGIRLLPEGQSFKTGVQLHIPITPAMIPAGKTIDDVVVMRAPQGGDAFVPLPTRRSGTAVVAQTEHFSDFVVVVSDGTGPLPCVDAVCLPTESCESCPIDCGLCLGANVCGNGLCESGEGCASCSADCLCSGEGGTPPPLTYLDPSTNLEWIRVVEATLHTFVDAVAYCDALTTDGRTDWRLATREEQSTILDYARGDTTHDPSIFTIPAGNRRWTATVVAGSTNSSAWTIETTGRTFGEIPSVMRNAACVRTAGTRVAQSFALDTDVVTDERSGLDWQRSPGPIGSFDDATTYCASLSLGAHASGWRVPSTNELLTIVDDSRNNPALDTDSFVSSGGLAWTTSSYSSNGFLWTIDFTSGVVDGRSPTATGLHVRCVH